MTDIIGIRRHFGRMAFIAFLAIAVMAIVMVMASRDAEAATDTVRLYRDPACTIDATWLANGTTVYVKAYDSNWTKGASVNATVVEHVTFDTISVALSDAVSPGNYTGSFVVWNDNGVNGTFTNDPLDLIDVGDGVLFDVFVDIDADANDSFDSGRVDYSVPNYAGAWITGTYWTDGPVNVVADGRHTVTISGTDDLSGVGHYEYNIDGSGWVTGSSFTVTGLSAFHLVEIRTVDFVGNVGPISSFNVYVAPFWTGSMVGTYWNGYAFGCNITVTTGNALDMYNFTLIMNSTAGNTQYIHVQSGGAISVYDGDGNHATDDRSVITNIDPNHYYYLNVYGGWLGVRDSEISHCGYLDSTGPEPTSFENLGVYVSNGYADLRGAELHSPMGVGIAFEGSGSYSINNEFAPNMTIHDCVVGFAMKDADGAAVNNVVVEDCYMFGGYVNNSWNFDVSGTNFTENGMVIVMPGGFGGGLFVKGDSAGVIDDVVFWNNDGIGLAVSGCDMEISNCVFNNNNQMSPNPMAEAVIISEGDAPETIYVTIHHNVVENSFDDHGFLMMGPVGISAWNNTFDVDGGYGIFSLYETESTHPYELPDFTVFDNQFYGYGGIHVYSQKYNSTNETSVAIGDVLVFDNEFDVFETAFFVDQYFEGATDGVFGDFTFTGNEVESDFDGLYVYERAFYECAIGADIYWGIIDVAGNNISFGPNSWNYGICFYDEQVYYADFAVINVNDVYIHDNNIEGGDGYGINFYGEMYYLDSSHVGLGYIEVARNNITMSGGYGMMVDSWDAGRLYGTTYVSMPGIWIHDNNVSGASSNIYVYWDYAGQYAYDFSTVRAGDLVIEDNLLGDVGSEYSLYVDQSEVGYYMYDNAVVTFGDVIIRNNVLRDTTFFDDSYGLYYYINDAGYEMRGNSSLTMGSLMVYGNDVVTDYEGIYIDINDIGNYMYDNSQAVYGDVLVYDNEFYTVRDYALDLYFDYLGYQMYHDSYFEMGDWIVTGNNCSSRDYANYISFNDFAYEMFDDSRAVIGDIIVEDNNITARAGGEEAVYIYYDYLGYEMYGRSTAVSGDFRYNNNRIDAWMTGISADVGDFGYYMYDDARFEYGNFEMNNNSIIAARNPASTVENGFYLAFDYVGYYLCGRSFATMGHVQLNDNNITVLHGADSDGLYISYIDDFGSNMYNEAVFIMTGNIEICRNVINNTLGNYGLYYDAYGFGYDMYGNNYAEYRNILVNDNTVIAGATGIDSAVDYIGYEMYGSSSVLMGNIELNRNVITGALTGDGIYTDWYDLGSYMYAYNIVTIGHLQINNNTINATSAGGTGMDLDFDYFAYYTYGTSVLTVGDIEVCGNHIISGSYGMYVDIYDFAESMYGYSSAYFGDIVFENNNVTSRTGSGIYFTDMMYYFAYYMYEESYVEFGDFRVQYNTVSSDSYGIYCYVYESGYEIVDSSRVVFGSILINWNEVNNSGSNDGIYLEFYEFGVYIYYSGTMTVGDIEIANNTVLSGGDGMYFDAEYFAYYVEETGVFEMGSVRINDNDIDTEFWGGDDGIYMEGFYYSFYDYTENAYGTMGNIEIMRNFIDANSNGIYWDYMYFFAAELEYNSRVIVGDILVCDNDITADSIGIYAYDWEYVGYDFDYTCSFEMGDLIFNGNAINSSSEGIYFYYLCYWGYDFYDDSSMVMGDFEVCNNWINSTDDGIYFSDSALYEWGAYLYDNARFEMGDWLINDNNITSDGKGILAYPSYIAYYNEDSSKVIAGDHEIMRNAIVATSYGIETWWLYMFGYELSDDSYAQFGDCRIMYNDINTTGTTGIYCGPYEFGYNVYDSADVIAGDYVLSDNDIVSVGYGIYLYVYEIGYYLDASSYSYASSTVALGDVRVDNNTVDSDTQYGVYVYYYYLGYELYDVSSVTVGKLSVNDNTIAGVGGIYLYCNEVGYDLYDATRTEIGGIEVARNTISSDTASAYGIYLYQDWFADTVSDDAYLWIGATDVHDNVILTSYGGIGFEYRFVPYVSGYAHVSIGGTFIHDCVVNATDFGLELTLHELDGSITADVFLFNGPVEISDCTFTSGGGMVLYGDAIDPSMEYLIHDLDFTQDKGSSEYAIESYNMPEFLIERCTFDGYVNGIYVNDGELIVADCDFDGINVQDVYMQNDGHLFLVECPDVNLTNMMFIDALSTVDVGWYHDVSVMTWVGGNGVPYADVEAVSNNTVFVEDAITGLDGHVTMLIRDKRYDQASYPAPALNFNPHNFTANKNGESGYTANVSVTGVGQSTIIYLNDTIAPVLGATDMSDLLATTGDPFGFRIGATDNLGIQSVRVYYRYGAGAWSFAIMTGGPLYEAIVTLSPTFVGTLEYYFRATDVNGLFDTTNSKYRTVVDNDAPTITLDSTANAGFRGQPFHFNATATDNVGVTGSYVVYRYGAGAPVNATLVAGIRTIALAWTPGSVLSYSFAFRDAAGNWRVGPTKIVAVVDNMSPLTATTGDAFAFSAAVNAGTVTSVSAEYWYGSGGHTVVAMTGSPYGYAATVPDALDNLSYRFLVVSDLGTFATPVTTLAVSDNDLPTIINDFTTAAASVGANFSFSFDALDNIGVVEVSIVYWYNADPQNVTLFNVTGPYLVTIFVPMNASGFLHYYYTVLDTSGNLLQTATANLPIMDSVAPSGFADLSDTAATTGDPFHFVAELTDNVGVTEVRFVYWFGSGTDTNASASGTGPYSADILAWSSYVGTMHYKVVGRDAAGNWFVGPVTDIPVIDNDAPAVTADNSDAAATLGGTFDFSFFAHDNIGIASFHLVWWLGSGAPTNVTIPGMSPFNHSIALPSTASDLHYFVAVSDGAGNWVTTSVVTIPVIDSTPPFLVTDYSDTSAYTGAQFDFIMQVDDDTAVESAYVTYRFGAGVWINVTLVIGPANATGSAAVPLDSLDALTYRLTAVDASGNWLVCAPVTVPVSDNVAPWLVGDGSDAIAMADQTFLFEAFAGDNIAVLEVCFVYSFDGGAETNVTLTSPYSGALGIPSNATSLSYRFAIADTSGNWHVTSDVVVTVVVPLSPAVLNDNSALTGYTGDPYLFSVSVEGGLSATEVHVLYWFGAGATTNASLLSGAIWTLETTLPSDSLQVMRYYFAVLFDDNTWGYGQMGTVDILDNDAPAIGADASDAAAYTGYSFVLDVSASDNIAVASTYAIYSYDGGAETNVTLAFAGTWTASIVVPSGVTELSYRFAAVDAAGNWVVGADNAVAVVAAGTGDILDTSDMLATTGDQFTFRASLTAGSGLTQVSVVYWFGAGAPSTAVMSGTGPFWYYLAIPADSLDALHYVLNATDGAGLYAETDEVVVAVADNDLPAIVSTSGTSTSATTGELVNFAVEVSDNVEVAGVSVIYTVAGGSQMTLALGSGTTLSGYITAPDVVGDIVYHYRVTDSSGNVADSPASTISIADNDDPELLSDATSSLGTTGDELDFSVTAGDNVAIGSVTVEVTAGTATATVNLTLATGVYVGSYLVPTGFAGTLVYVVTVEDTSGNAYVADARSVLVQDDDDAVVGEDTTPEEGTVGEEFSFSVEATDNVGIDEVFAVFWYNDDTARLYLPLSLSSGVYTASFTPTEEGELHYRILVRDTSGNEVQSAESTVALAPGADAGDDSDGGIPWWVWLVIVLLLLVIVILAVLLVMATTKGKGGDGGEAELEEIPADTAAGAAGAGASGAAAPSEPAKPEEPKTE